MDPTPKINVLHRVGLVAISAVCISMFELLCSFGIKPSALLVVQSPLMPNQSANTSLLVQSDGGNVQKMEPLTLIQVAVKNNVGVHYFAVEIPMNMHFSSTGAMGEEEQRRGVIAQPRIAGKSRAWAAGLVLLATPPNHNPE